MERLTRTTATDFEVRGDGRTIAGIAVPFGVAARIGGPHGFDETFRRGAFARTISERGDKVKLLAVHNTDQMPLGKVVVLREDAAGLYIEARVSATVQGDEVLTLIRDGAIDSFSIGFSPVKDEWNTQRTAVTRTETRLHEVSAVAFPAFDTARITSVRNEQTEQPLAIPAHLDPLVWSLRFY